MKTKITEKGHKFPINTIFKDLCRQWCAKKETTYAAMVRHFNAKIEGLNLTPQLLCQYKSGSNFRKPPLFLVISIAAELGLELVVNKDGVFFQRYKGRKRQGIIENVEH